VTDFSYRVDETKRAADLDVRALRKVIEDGVYRGVMKAVAVYFLVSFIVALIVWLISSSSAE